MFESIGPLWDGNEVWLVIAGGATFAAFPVWYATMFSGFYLALLLILVLLIVRVLSFEWREKAERPRWKAVWAWLNTIGSVGAPLLWGIALASLLHGVPIASDQTFAGDFGDLFSGYTVARGDRRLPALRRSTARSSSRCARSATSASAPGAAAPRLAPAAARRRRRLPRLDARRRERLERQGRLPRHPPRRGGRRRRASRRSGLVRAGNERWAFVATATTIVAVVVTLFVSLYPRVHGLAIRTSRTASRSRTPPRRTTRSR